MGNERKEKRGKEETINILGQDYPYIDTTQCPRAEKHKQAAANAAYRMTESHVNSSSTACILKGEEHVAVVQSEFAVSGSAKDGIGKNHIHHVEISVQERDKKI